MDLSILIVNWNSAKLLQDCLASAEKFLNDLNYEIIVVDNNSNAQEVQYLKESVQPLYPWVRFVYNNENSGFARANNQALKMAKGNNILLLNPDTCFIESGLIALIQQLQNKEIGLVSCKLLNADQSLQLSCFNFPYLWRILGISLLIHKLLPARLRRLFVYSIEDLKECRNPDWVLGAFMLLSKHVIEKIGGFDDNIFMYGEDMDLCYQVRQLGLLILYNPEYQIIHYGDASGSQAWSNAKREVLIYRAIFHFYRKYLGRGQLLIARVIFALGSLIRIAAFGISSLWPGHFKKSRHEIHTQWLVFLTQFNR